MIRLTVDNFADGHLTVQRLKGSLRTTQPLVESEDPLFNELQAVSEFTRGLAGNQRLFPMTRQHFWRLVRKYAALAELPAHKRCVRILKHSIAMQTIHSAGIENVRQYLGHKSISSTGAYLKVSDEQASAEIGRAIGAKRD